jgi:integrase/recombinase XerC
MHMDISKSPSISNTINDYLDSVYLSRSQNTALTYKNALKAFTRTLIERKLDPDKEDISKLSEQAVTWFAKELKQYAPATERLYLNAVTLFYEYIASQQLVDLNVRRVRALIRQHARRSRQRLPQFPRDSIDKMVVYANKIHVFPVENEADRLRNYRDRAFLLVLADTGLRVHEACGLIRGDINWHEAKAIVIGKGNQQAVVRFSSRSITALKDYINIRSEYDGISGKPLTSLPLFGRHDRGAGKKIKPITTTTGRNIVALRVKECLGPSAVGTITPHSFRHYFVTSVLFGSGGNLKLAQKLARHKNISVTQLYAHLTDDELDKGYYEIFENQ